MTKTNYDQCQMKTRDVGHNHLLELQNITYPKFECFVFPQSMNAHLNRVFPHNFSFKSQHPTSIG